MESEKGRVSNGICTERICHMKLFLDAIRELTMLQNDQAKAVIEGDADFARFDLLIHMANEKKDHAKYALLFHIEQHGC